MQASWRRCIGYSKLRSYLAKKRLLAWNQNKEITYSIFCIIIPNSVLIFFTIAQIC